MRLHLVPISQLDARNWIAERHRHCRPPRGSIFQVAVADDEGVVRGVAMCGRPVARSLQDGFTLEVNRTCTDGARNANSKLYGACARAAWALGYRRLVTYTLDSEPGTSLLAAGWKVVAEVRGNRRWDTPARRRTNDTPDQQKLRWEKSR